MASSSNQDGSSLPFRLNLSDGDHDGALRLRPRSAEGWSQGPPMWRSNDTSVPGYLQKPPVSSNTPSREFDAVDPANITPAQLRKFLASDTVTIYVGLRREEFKLSKDLLCHVSPFFKAAFTGPFLEGTSQTMTLTEDSVSAFDVFVAYIYRGVFPTERALIGRTKRKLCTLLHAYELAERFQMPVFRRAALKALETALTHTKVEPKDVVLAFGMLAADSRAMNVLLDHVAEDFMRADADYGASSDKFGKWKFAAQVREVEGFDVAFMMAMRRLASATKVELERETESERYVRQMIGAP